MKQEQDRAEWENKPTPSPSRAERLVEQLPLDIGNSARVIEAACWRHQRYQDGQPLGVETPFRHLNRILGGGFQPGQTYVLGSPPGSGKSSIAMSLSRHVCKRGGRVLYLAYEVSPDACRMRALSDIASITADSLQEGKFDPDSLRKFLPRLEDETNGIAFVDATVEPRPNVPLIGEAIGRHKSEDPFSNLIVVDYLQMAARLGGYDDKRDVRDKVAQFSSDMTALARYYNVPILFLASLSRANYKEDDEDATPSMSAFKEAGEIESDADVAMMLWPKAGIAWSKLKQQDKWDMEIHVLKNRHGKTGKARIDFDRTYQRFTGVG